MQNAKTRGFDSILCMGLYAMFVIAERTDGKHRHKLYTT